MTLQIIYDTNHDLVYRLDLIHIIHRLRNPILQFDQLLSEN